MKLNDVVDDYLFLTENYGEAEMGSVFVGGLDSAGNLIEYQSIQLTLKSFKIWIYYRIFEEVTQLDFISAQASLGRPLVDEQLLTTHDPELVALYKWFAFNKENRKFTEEKKENK